MEQVESGPAAIGGGGFGPGRGGSLPYVVGVRQRLRLWCTLATSVSPVTSRSNSAFEVKVRTELVAIVRGCALLVRIEGIDVLTLLVAVIIYYLQNSCTQLSPQSLRCCILAPWHFFGALP